MNKNKIISELEIIYRRLKKEKNLKLAMNALNLLAKLEGFFATKIDTVIEDLSDAQLDFLLEKMANKYHDA